MRDTSYHRTGLSRPSTPGSGMGAAALAYARRGVPVFRLRPGTKEPFHGSRGFYDATTDPERIRRWWRESPDANIGIPTGERSGLLVLDVDPAEGGTESLAALEAEHEGLPATTTVATGRGGLHRYFVYPVGSGIGISVGRHNGLGAGLDVRGEGGYVVAPPSRTEGPYEFLERLPKGELPGWLLEALTAPHEPSRGEPGSPRRSTPGGGIGDGPILEGGRNHALTSIAGRLHDGTRDLTQLTEDLATSNEERCSPPLPGREVEKIAGSIHARTPCRPAAPEASPEVLEALDGFEAAFWAKPWPGMGGRGERDLLVALIKAARKHGQLIPAGVRVSMSVRELALAAGVEAIRVQPDQTPQERRLPPPGQRRPLGDQPRRLRASRTPALPRNVAPFRPIRGG